MPTTCANSKAGKVAKFYDNGPVLAKAERIDRASASAVASAASAAASSVTGATQQDRHRDRGHSRSPRRSPPGPKQPGQRRRSKTPRRRAPPQQAAAPAPAAAQTASKPGWIGSRAECPSGGHPTWMKGMSCKQCWAQLSKDARWAEHSLAVSMCSRMNCSQHCQCEEPASCHGGEGGCWVTAKQSGTMAGWCEPCWHRQCCATSDGLLTR